MPMPARKAPRAIREQVERWNAEHPVGTLVNVWRTTWCDDLKAQARTRTEAFVSDAGHPVVFIEGVRGYWLLDAITPVELVRHAEDQEATAIEERPLSGERDRSTSSQPEEQPETQAAANAGAVATSDFDAHYMIAHDGLTDFYSAGDAKTWLNSQHPLLKGETPIHLLGTDRAHEVFALIDQLRSGAYI